MPERRDRSVDVHMRDGVLRKGRPLGHSDPKGRIREADSPLKRGNELGYIDEKQRVRRRAGLLRRGDVVGRLRGNAAYTSEGLLGGGVKVGFVDELGQVWQVDCDALRGRIVGRVRGADPEAGLAYFLLKFAEIDDAIRVLEEKIAESEDKYAFLPRVRGIQRILPEVDALGDFDALVRRLDALEETCVTDLGQHMRATRAELDETVRSKPTPETILASLRDEWGIAVPEQADALVGRVRGALEVLQDARRTVRGEAPEDRRTPTLPPPPSAAPPERDDRSRRVEQLLESTLGSVERVREEIDRMRHDPDYRADELVDRVRSAMTSVLEVRERLVGDGHGNARKRDERASVRPGAPAPTLAGGSLATAPTSPAISVPSTRTDLVRFDDDAASETRKYIETMMKTREADQVFEILDLGIERLREIDTVRRDGVGRLRKALDAIRKARG